MVLFGFRTLIRFMVCCGVNDILNKVTVKVATLLFCELKSNTRNLCISTIKCYHCQEMGHNKNECKKRGTAWQKDKSKFGQPDAINFAFSAGEFQNVWYMDSGSSKHYTKSKQFYTYFEELQDTLTVADGKSVKIAGVGSIQFKTTGG